MLRPILLGTAAILAGCLTPPDNDVIQWSEDFEACPDLCDWSRAGDASRVTTYHPGEHALRLGPGASVSHPLSIVRGGVDDGWQTSFNDGNWLELTTDCAGPGALELRELAAGQDAIEVALDDVDVGRFMRHRVNFPPIDPAFDVTFARIDLKAGARACVIDNVQVRISGGQVGY